MRKIGGVVQEKRVLSLLLDESQRFFFDFIYGVNPLFLRHKSKLAFGVVLGFVFRSILGFPFFIIQILDVKALITGVFNFFSILIKMPGEIRMGLVVIQVTKMVIKTLLERIARIVVITNAPFADDGIVIAIFFQELRKGITIRGQGFEASGARIDANWTAPYM